ncbi:MAG: hypothetical protein A2087_04240 [Spirochaetes bacterium GWD1_61_31]|nr:MAG: hypothetical protein A2Y37_10805 [Spirochaetes bacterium GWB1_60_80]OHD29412.1 MAG: hypothetical protein A2004_03800 [Spirochaetes bacterium GWC1_61_12]OHD35419.1 MAG: hypothetical protein A2087_04240 [Spirochaetes bacterium GWD1_61_31]OHD44928.1 MAG: hypothetical protein A2Y35_12845 [Spirochaetes bacterium GWE1_60_18]OHD60038.1 MAG: hypothetical protein A2Y32_10960 [Spirochaetes bacterium GWF1_60_12]HAP43598.1 undecaprenyl-diphosphatase [Spirochaetaceae bacterium]
MTILQAILLGAFQGVAEFLPISSSGHLVLLKELMGLAEVPALFDIILHVATLCSILLVFGKRIGAILVSIWRWLTRKHGEADAGNLALVGPALLATALTAAIGLAIRKLDLVPSPQLVGGGLLLTALLLLVSGRVQGKTAYQGMRWWHGALVGLGQGIGVLPGVSRSGITISAGLGSGLRREVAGEFSFLLAIPAILGALLLEAGDVGALMGTVAWLPLLLGSLVACLVGVLALCLLLPLVRRGKLAWFAIYLVPVGLVSIFLL